MGLARGVTRAILRPSLSRAIGSDGGASGGGSLIPASLRQLLYPGDQPAYYTEEQFPDDSHLLKDYSSDVGSLRPKRLGYLYNLTGSEYILVAGLVGTETVVSSEGTSTPTISAGRIDFTAGTCWDLVLSNGSHYPLQEESGTTAYDISGNDNHGTITNAVTSGVGSIHQPDAGVTKSYPNDAGYRLSGGVYIPAKSATLAADGNALTETGEVPRYGTGLGYGWQGDGSTVYVDLGEPIIPATADFTIELPYFHAIGTSSARGIISQRNAGVTDLFQLAANYTGATGSANKLGLALANPSYSTIASSVDLVPGTWYEIKVSRVGNLWTLYLNDTEVGSVTRSFSVSQTPNTLIAALTTGAVFTDGIAGPVTITTGGVTTSFHPIPGTRDVAKVVSNGQGSVISNAVVNGVLADLYTIGDGSWRLPHIENGAHWDGTAIYPAGPGQANAVNGNPINIPANVAPRGLLTDRTGGVIAPLDYTMGTDGYTAEEYNDVPADVTVNKRGLSIYAADRYGAALEDIQS